MGIGEVIGTIIGYTIGILGILLIVAIALAFLWLSLLMLGICLQIFGQLFAGLSAARRSGDAPYSSGEIDSDPYGTGGADLDENEWRYKASGGYDGEFMDEMYGGNDRDS